MPTMKTYTTTDLARQTGLSRKTIWRWVRDGKLNSMRYGARYRIQEADWQRFLTACNPRGTTK